MEKVTINNETRPVDSLIIPDLWHLVTWLKDHSGKPVLDEYYPVALSLQADMVLDCWHLCHQLLSAVRALPEPPPHNNGFRVECTRVSNQANGLVCVQRSPESCTGCPSLKVISTSSNLQEVK